MTNTDSPPSEAQPHANTASPPKPPRLRAALYVDGFNMYHSIDDLGQPFLKWLNLAEVARHLVIGKPEDIERVVFCTAIRTDNPSRMIRHRLYARALAGAKVEVLEGYFADEERSCHGCGNEWKHPTEKEGDTSLAITIIDDAHRNRFDVAYLLTADGDQAPVARMIKASFPDKRIISVSPPGRRHNKNILSHSHGSMAVTPDMVEKCLFPRGPLDSLGNMAIRPSEYDPPPGWVAPHLRPRKRE